MVSVLLDGGVFWLLMGVADIVVVMIRMNMMVLMIFLFICFFPPFPFFFLIFRNGVFLGVYDSFGLFKCCGTNKNQKESSDTVLTHCFLCEIKIIKKKMGKAPNDGCRRINVISLLSLLLRS